MMSDAAIDEAKYVGLLAEALPVAIQTEQEYERLLAVVEPLFDKGEAALTPEEGRLLELLTILLQEYEDRTDPMPERTPQDILLHLIEEHGIQRTDLRDVFGTDDLADAVLRGKHAISREQAEQLAARFHVTADLFL